MTNILSHKSFRRPCAKDIASALALGVASFSLSVALATPAHAQEVNASLRGKVTVEGGASQISAIEVATGITRSTPVAADGSYNFPSLRPGTYRLEVTTPGGVRRTDEFTLAVAQNAVLDFDLAAPAPAETAQPGAPASDSDVVVVGSRIRSMEGGEVGVNISQRLIEQLPQNNRNFLAFADLAPGVQFITNSSGQSRLQGGAQDSRTVNVFIDGVGQKDYVLKNGITGQDSTQGNPFPQLAIGEYRVISSNYKAEFDQVSSVAITAVTKSGTNEFHGEGFIDFTNQHLRAATPGERRDGRKIKTKDIQFGGAFGGPIIKDMMHFFVTYEGKRRTQPREVSPGLDLPVSFFPSEYQGFFGSAQEEFNENLYFGKIDFTPTSKDLFELSVKYRDESGETFNSGIAAFETRTIAKVEEWRGLARWEHSEDRWINDLKIAYEDVTWGPRPAVNDDTFLFNATVTDPNTGLSRRGDILRIGGGSNFQDKGQKGWSIQNDFTWIGFENHTIKAGVKAKWVKLNTFQANNLNPLYIFNVAFNPGGGTFNDTIPYRVQFFEPFGDADPRIKSNNFQLGLYVQDDWDVTERLTVNLGIRWDYERTPAWLNYEHDPAIAEFVAGRAPYTTPSGTFNYPNLINADYDIDDYISTGKERKPFKGAFQPRIGFTYDIDGERRWVVFGGYGRSYDRNQFDFIQQELAQGLATNRTFNFLNAGSPEPCAPSVTCVPWDPIYLTPAGRDQLIANAPPGAGGELRFIKNDLKMPYSDQFSLGLRHRVNNLIEAEVGYSHIVSKDGFVFLLGNRRPDGTFFPPTGNPSSPFGNPPSPFGSIIIGDNGLETKADSVYLKANKSYSPASPWSLTATYTFTKAKENRQFGEVFSLDFPSADDYPFVTSAGVRKHRLVMAGTADLPFGFVASGKFQIASPKYLQRFTFIAGDPLSRDVSAIKTEGNGGRWGFRQLDLALTKNFTLPFLSEDAKIWARVDVLNVLNDRNYNSFSAITGERNPNNLDIDGIPRTFKLSTGFAF